MSFLFKVNGIEHEKTTKIMMVLNFIQATCGWLEFIACIILGDLKLQIKDFNGSITDNEQKTYNPTIALFAVIGILQTLFGVFIGLALMGKLPFVEARKLLWLRVVHYGLLVQFGFVCYICLQASTQATIFAAINDTNIQQFAKKSSGDKGYKYYQAFVVYSRYLIAWAIMEFLICLPIAVANLYAIYTRHMNYEALQIVESEDKSASVVQPEAQYTGRNEQVGMEGNGGAQGGQGGQGGYVGQQFHGGYQLESPKPLEVQMMPK